MAEETPRFKLLHLFGEHLLPSEISTSPRLEVRSATIGRKFFLVKSSSPRLDAVMQRKQTLNLTFQKEKLEASLANQTPIFLRTALAIV
jgi:hypothetical protein